MSSSADYEKGYQDGESNGYADWMAALSEEFDIEMPIGPQDFISKLRAAYTLLPK